MDQLGEILRSRRQELGLSQAEVARAAGVHLRQIRRYEANEQQPVLQVAARLASALGVSVNELAGLTTAPLQLTGAWWAAWQTFVGGDEIITTQPVTLKQFGATVDIEAVELTTENTRGDYLWRGELRVWDAHVLMGWYIATDPNVRSKGTMFFTLHTQGRRAEGRWVGISYDGPIVSGWAALAQSRDEVQTTIDRLKHSTHGS